ADDPVLEIEQIVYQKNGSPIEFSRSRNRYDVRAYSYLKSLKQCSLFEAFSTLFPLMDQLNK
ncbi:hypothetical protein ACM20Q_16245, partial [Enterococcus casseliflavus]